MTRELSAARDAVRARDAAAAAAGFAFVDAASLDAAARDAAGAAPAGAAVGAVAALALLTQAAHQLLDTAGEGTLGK